MHTCQTLHDSAIELPFQQQPDFAIIDRLCLSIQDMLKSSLVSWAGGYTPSLIVHASKPTNKLAS
jgi:hypothetical protein